VLKEKPVPVPNMLQEKVNFSTVLCVITNYKRVSAVKSGKMKESIEMLGTLSQS